MESPKNLWSEDSLRTQMNELPTVAVPLVLPLGEAGKMYIIAPADLMGFWRRRRVRTDLKVR
jgi:hypothetical protein